MASKPCVKARYGTPIAATKNVIKNTLRFNQTILGLFILKNSTYEKVVQATKSFSVHVYSILALITFQSR